MCVRTDGVAPGELAGQCGAPRAGAPDELTVQGLAAAGQVARVYASARPAGSGAGASCGWCRRVRRSRCAVGAGPLVGAVAGALVGPAGEGLGPVMSPAQRGEVLWVGLAGWSALVGRDVGVDVVEVAGPGVAAAPGEHAVPVAEDDELAHPRWRVVLVDGVGAVEVEDREDPGLRVVPASAGSGRGWRGRASRPHRRPGRRRRGWRGRPARRARRGWSAPASG